MTDLVKSVSIDALLLKRDAAVERLERALDFIAEAEDIAASSGFSLPMFSVSKGYSRGYEFRLSSAHVKAERAEVVACIKQAIDSTAWQYLMNESGLRTFMDSGAREKWDKQISEQQTPELTRANIEATFSMLYASRGDMFERGIIECFKGLSWCYRTNLPQKFGKRIILTGIRSYYGRASGRLDDLDRVFHVLDGKPEPDHRSSAGRALESLARQKTTGASDMPYFSARWFKNGNAHLTFLRPDLVDKMNLVIAKHYPGALPEPK